MEKELGIKIFTRTKNGMVPTKQGKVLIKKAYEILSKLYEFKEEAKYQEELSKSVLKISCTTALSYQVFHALLEFQKKFPNVTVEIRENIPGKVLKDVKLDECDIGLLQAEQADLEEELGIVHTALSSGRLCICVCRNSRLIAHEFVTPDDLINERFIVFNEEHSKELKDSLFPNNKVAFLTNNLDIIRKSVVAGQGISIGYDSVIKNEPEVLNGDIKIIPFKNIHSNKSSDISFWYIRSYYKPFSEISKFFLECLQIYC